MLARQAWRLLQWPDSLCARLLQAKYFPSGNMMTAKEGPGISYTWRSLLRGLRALEKGIIWRVGDGEQIRIWDDPWIPAGTTRRPRTPRGATLLTKVAELIVPITNSWDEELVKDIFWEEDVMNILAIPLRPDREDFIAWHFDSKGVFSVKSSYYVLESNEEQNRVVQRGESSTNDRANTERSIWKKIWQLPCPPKIRQFVWRLAHNSLAVKMNISRRNIVLDTRCPICKRFDEDGAHCFLKCKHVRKCWKELQLEDVRCLLLNIQSSEEFIRIILTFFDNSIILALKPDRCLRSIVLLWKLWDVRNKVNAGETMPTCLDVACCVSSVIREIQGDVVHRLPNLNMQRRVWKPPGTDQLKINFDGAFCSEDRKAACGFIIRKHVGEAVLAGAANISPALDALSADSAACLFALEAVADTG
jgi:hypothetical protein